MSDMTDRTDRTDAGGYYMLRVWRQVDMDGVIYDTSWHFDAADRVAARRQFHESCDEIDNDRRLEMLFAGLWTAAGKPLMFRRPWAAAVAEAEGESGD